MAVTDPVRGPDEHGGVRVRLRVGHNNADRPHVAENPLVGLKWGETVGNPDCPLMRRWVVETPLGSLRLHRFYHSDDDRSLHDHPWWFVTFPLGRGYLDETYCQVCDGWGCRSCGESGRVRRLVPAWRPTFRPSSHTHAVVVGPEGVWTLILSGRKRRRWGFWTRDAVGAANGERFLESRRYFGLFGHAPCED